ncbi:MAG: hypothetical protein ACR2QM_19140 [Longimicrobiales bacterium]
MGRFGLLTLSLLSVQVSLVGFQPLSGQEGIQAYDFLLGSWEGELEYLDYGDNRTRVQLPTALECAAAEDGMALELEFSYEEPDGSIVASIERLVETSEGLYFGDLWSIEEPAREVSPGVFRLVLARQGQDNGRDALIQNVISVEQDELTITTMVQYEGSTDRLQRNQYRLVKAGQSG